MSVVIDGKDEHRWHYAWPVGCTFVTPTETPGPDTVLGFGTWSLLGAGRLLLGKDPDVNGAPQSYLAAWFWKRTG